MLQKKYYLTKEGLEKTRKDYEDLKNLKLSKTKGEVPEIRHSEDLNPEYLAFQEDLELLESRLNDLEYILKNAELIKPPAKEAQNNINLGATVMVQVNGQTDKFTLVGTLEANPSLGRISNESPVGQQLLGHKKGDEVLVSSPIRTIYKIKKIEYKLI